MHHIQVHCPDKIYWYKLIGVISTQPRDYVNFYEKDLHYFTRRYKIIVCGVRVPPLQITNVHTTLHNYQMGD